MSFTLMCAGLHINQRSIALPQFTSKWHLSDLIVEYSHEHIRWAPLPWTFYALSAFSLSLQMNVLSKGSTKAVCSYGESVYWRGKEIDVMVRKQCSSACC